MGESFIFDIAANDMLFGLPVVGSSLGTPPCDSTVGGITSIAITQFTGTPVAAGTCSMIYNVETSAGNDSATINVTVAPA